MRKSETSLDCPLLLSEAKVESTSSITILIASPSVDEPCLFIVGASPAPPPPPDFFCSGTSVVSSEAQERGVGGAFAVVL